MGAAYKDVIYQGIWKNDVLVTGKVFKDGYLPEELIKRKEKASNHGGGHGGHGSSILTIASTNVTTAKQTINEQLDNFMKKQDDHK